MESDVKLDEKYACYVGKSVRVECCLGILTEQSGEKISGIPDANGHVEQKEMSIDWISAVF
jgi:hypothetical protein